MINFTLFFQKNNLGVQVSCCSKGYCQFTFPDGPPLTDNSVASLSANYLFLPYGTLLSEGEVIRIWTENGQTKTVVLEKKMAVDIKFNGVELEKNTEFLPWQLVALDSGMALEDLESWYHHPLFNPEVKAVVLKFKHPVVAKPSLKMILLKWLYKLRTL